MRWEYYMANLFRTICTKFYQNWPLFCTRYDKKFWCFFGSKCSCTRLLTNVFTYKQYMVEACAYSYHQCRLGIADFSEFGENILIASVRMSGQTLTTSLRLHMFIYPPPLPSARQHPSCDDYLEVKREYYQNSSVLDCVTQCSQSAAHLYEQFLQVQQIGFVTLGPLRCV